MSSASTGIGWFAVPLAIIAGAFRGGTPFLFVSLGECLTEKSGRINLGLEGCPRAGNFRLAGANREYHGGKRFRWNRWCLPLAVLPWELERTRLERAGD